MDLRELFDDQLRKLEKADFSRLALGDLEKQRQGALERARSSALGECDLPFMPILPRSHFLMTDMMPYQNGPDGEKIFVHPRFVTDVVVIPDKPYYIFGIDIGKSRMGGIRAGEEWVRNCGRRFLAAHEVLNLGIHTNALEWNKGRGLKLMALGSRYDTTRFPFLRAYPTTKLHYFSSLDVKIDGVCVPSCLP